MSAAELHTCVVDLTHQDIDNDHQVDNLVMAMIELDELRFDKIISSSIIKQGFEYTFENLLYKFLEKIGILWQIGAVNPAQEHFISNLIRLKLSVAIDNLPMVSDPEAKRVFLFLPEWELHEMGLLTYYYMARKKGFKVFYLGQKVPMPDLFELSDTVKADLLATFFVTGITENEILNYLKGLCSHFSTQQIYISGMQAANLSISLPVNVKYVQGAGEFKKLLEKMTS
jgi:methanogenic corrinoid protein MtbC1